MPASVLFGCHSREVLIWEAKGDHPSKTPQGFEGPTPVTKSTGMAPPAVHLTPMPHGCLTVLGISRLSRETPPLTVIPIRAATVRERSPGTGFSQFG